MAPPLSPGLGVKSHKCLPVQVPTQLCPEAGSLWLLKQLGKLEAAILYKGC